MSFELDRIVEGVHRDDLVTRLESQKPLLREYSWESYDVGFNEARGCKTVSDLNPGLFRFNALLSSAINPRELYMIGVEKLSVFQYAKGEELRKPSLVYLLHSMQLCLQSSALADSSTLIDGLGVILSAISCLIETISAGNSSDNVAANIDEAEPFRYIHEIVEISMQFAQGLALKSTDWGTSSSWTSSSHAASPTWNVSEADDITGFTLNSVSHFVTAISDETNRSRVMSMALEVLRLLHMDVRSLTAVPRNMRSFLYSSKAYHARNFHRISQLENLSDEATDSAQSDAVAIAKGMKLGLCGSGLDDGSQMSHLSGLERSIFAHHGDEQRQLLVLYSRVCFGEGSEQVEDSADGGYLHMGNAEMVPWRAVNDRSVRSQIESWRGIHDAMSHPASGHVMDRTIACFLGEAAAKRFPGGSEFEAASWPVLGCAMVVSHSISLLGRGNTMEGALPDFSYPVGVLTASFMYQDVEPLLYSLMSHPRTATCEGLHLLTTLGLLLPAPGSSQNSFLPGYTYLGSATGIDTNGYNVNGAAQVAPSPWEADGRLRKRAFGVNAVVSHVGWGEKKRVIDLIQGSSQALNVDGAHVEDIRCIGQLCATSTDSHYIVQAIVSAIIQAPAEIRAQEAYVALQKRLALFEPRGLCVLLRRLIQECPYGKVSGLLVDVIKSCTQRSSRSKGGEWCLRTRISSRVNRRMIPALDRLQLPANHCAKQFRQISKDPMPAFLSQTNERAAEEEKPKTERSGPRQDLVKQGEIAEESFFLSWKEASPFWSPFWVATLACSSLEMLVTLSSAKVEHDLDAIAASVTLLQYTLQRIQASNEAIRGSLENANRTEGESEHVICLRNYLLPYDPSVSVPVRELSIRALLTALENGRGQLFGPLLDLLEDAASSVDGLIARREKTGGPPAVLLRLQVLSMNIKHIVVLLDI